MRRSGKWPRAVAGALAASLVAGCGATARPEAVARTSKDAGPCFGAAARDPARPSCLRSPPARSVTPAPADARRQPNSPCEPVERAGLVSACAFGADPPRAVGTVALIGDSHASHWRGAMEIVAQARRWRGISIMRSSCPLSTATRRLPEPKRSQCTRWRSDLFAWFERHPEVRTVFAGALSGGTGVVVEPGEDAFDKAVQGYLDAWRRLPASVERLVVIRDTPKTWSWTGRCIERAAAAGRFPGRACAVSRRARLDRDPAVAAARRLRSERVHVVDLTPIFCGRRRCYPVIGGALVLRDVNHMTATFASTLGAPLLRKVDALSAGW